MVAEEADLVQAEFQTARTTWETTKNSEALPYYEVTRIYSALFVWILLVIGSFPFLRQSLVTQTGAHYVSEDDLELVIFLCPPLLGL